MLPATWYILEHTSKCNLRIQSFGSHGDDADDDETSPCRTGLTSGWGACADDVRGCAQEKAARRDVEEALRASEETVAQEKAAGERLQTQYRQMLIDQEIKLRTEMEIAVASERATKQASEHEIYLRIIRVRIF